MSSHHRSDGSDCSGGGLEGKGYRYVILNYVPLPPSHPPPEVRKVTLRTCTLTHRAPIPSPFIYGRECR